MRRESIYISPESTLLGSDALALRFSTLGFWRKFYIVFIWLTSSAMGVSLIFLGLEDDDVPVAVYAGIAVVMLAFTYWHHYAVVQRNTTQLMVLAVMSIFPIGNIISGLILLAIRGTTKAELARYAADREV